jgi:hypothetical protein
MFLINERLNLKTDAQSIVNLKLLMLRRTGGLPQKLHKHTSTSLQTDITSICKVDEITDVFAELQRIEQPEGLRIRHALEFTRLKIKGFDYRLRVGGEDGELLSCIWMTARMRAGRCFDSVVLSRTSSSRSTDGLLASVYIIYL